MLKNKPVLMIHEVREWMFDLPLENYVLTFDDGLYSQFYYFDHFKNINTEKIYFISSGIVCQQESQSLSFPPCYEAHEKAFRGIYEDYMTLDQIRYLMKFPNVTIGGHSHFHKKLGLYDKLLRKLEHIKYDTELMLDWFHINLDFRPTHFCFPYNENYGGLYNAALKQYGFDKIYGGERVAIESLREAQQS